MRGKTPLPGNDNDVDVAPSTVFVVDDDPWMRAMGREVAVGAGLAVETYASGEQFLAAYRPDRPGCIVLDVRMPGMSGLDVQQALRALRSLTPVIVISGYADVTMAVETLRAGAVEFLEKPFSGQVLMDRISSVVETDRYRRCMAARFAAFAERVLQLTARERDVLRLLVRGHPNWQIAQMLVLSRRTVETHRAKLMSKTGVDSLAELIRFGLQLERAEAGVGFAADTAQP